MLKQVLLAYPVALVDRWGATNDLATSSLHSSRLSVFLMAAPSVMPVYSIPGCCPPISFSVCFFFALLALCPAGLSWQALKILLCTRTISVCVALLWSRGLRVAQWLAEFCFAPLRWRCGLCRWCRGAFWGISSPWPVSFSLCLLLVSKTHRRTGIWTWLGSASVWSLSWALYSCHSRWSWVWASAAVAWAILARISGLDPSSAMIAPRYLKQVLDSAKNYHCTGVTLFCFSKISNIFPEIYNWR